MEKCGYLFLFAAGNGGPSLMTTDRSNYAMRVAAVTSHSYLTDNILTVEPDGTYPIPCLPIPPRSFFFFLTTRLTTWFLPDTNNDDDNDDQLRMPTFARW